MAEEIRFPIVGEDRGATRVLKDVGRESAVTAAQTRLLAETLDKEQRAANSATDALLKVEKAAVLVAVTERALAAEAGKADRALRDQSSGALKFEQAAKNAAGSGGVGALIGSGGMAGGGMAALVAAGVALAPVIATVGVGLGGLGLAALSAGKRSKELQQELVPLKAQFKAFGDSVEPALLTDFAAAAQLAGQVLKDIQPVTVATGKALAGFLGQLRQNFAGQEWQQFFQFMASTAGPDVRLLGQNLIDLTNTLPPLLEQLQPLSLALLHVTDGITKVIQADAQLSHGQDGLTNINRHAVLSWQTVGDAVHRTINFLAPGVPVLQKLSDQQQRNTMAAYKQSAAMDALDQRVTHTRAATADLIRPLGTVTAGLTSAGDASWEAYHKASLAASAVTGLASAIQHLNTQLSNSIKPNSTFNTDLIGTASAAVQAEKALDKTHDAIGLNTAAQRTAFGYQQTYIDNLVTLTTDAGKNREKQDEATAAIRRALPQLENVKGGTRQYWQEVRTLVGWLHREEEFKKLRTLISVNAQGTWQLAPGGGLPGGTAGGPFPQAAGGLIRGGTLGRDSVPIMAMPGEVVVPTKMVAAGLVDHLRGSLPGFAAGGIVPSYSGNPGGMGSWAQHNFYATIHAEIAGIAKGVAGALSSVMASTGAGMGGAGVARWAPLVLRVLAMLGQPSADLGVALRQMQTESGGNPMAINLWDSNAAAGDPSRGLMQVIGSTFAAYAGPFRGLGIYNPEANIYAGLNYATHRYGAAWTRVLGQGHGYDQGGYLPPGLSLAYNGTGKPERVGGGNTYNITVNVPVTADKAGVGRQVVEAIREFEKRSGAGWRS